MERPSPIRRTSLIPIIAQALDPAGSGASAVHNPSISSLSSSSPWSLVNLSSSELDLQSNARSYNSSDSAFATPPWSSRGPYTSSERSPSNGAVRTPMSTQRSSSNPAIPPGSTNINAVPDRQNTFHPSAANAEVDEIFPFEYVQADPAWYGLFDDQDVLEQMPPALLEDNSGFDTRVSNMRSQSDPNLPTQQSLEGVLPNSTPPLCSSIETNPIRDNDPARGRTEKHSEPQPKRRATIPPAALLDIDGEFNDEGFQWPQTINSFNCLYPDYGLRFEQPAINTEPPRESTPASNAINSSKTNGSKAKRQKLDPDQKQKVKRVRGLGACLRCRIYREPVILEIQKRRSPHAKLI